MTRVLRYPRMSVLSCIAVMLCAFARDACLGASLFGWAQVLLVATAALLALSVLLLSCRFFVDFQGVGVGCGLRVRRTHWEDVASFGLLCCNSRRRYFYGMYRGQTDFINLLHRAPICGQWGFVVPVSRKLLRAIGTCCPFEIDLSAMPGQKREGRLRRQWHQALYYAAIMLPTAAFAFATGALMLMQAARIRQMTTVTVLTLGAMGLFGAGLTLLYRVANTALTCPAFNEKGVRAGIRLPWEQVHFGYVHRIAKMSGLFLLSQPLEKVERRNAPPILCLSMPDTQTMLVAYLMYCPHANKGLEI